MLNYRGPDHRSIGKRCGAYAPGIIRPPKGGLEPFTGLSRAKLYELITPNATNEFKPPVKSVCLRKPGAVKGARLIHLQSLLDYLHRNAEGGEN